MRDLATAEGRVALNERIVEAHEIGQPLSAITTGVGVRIYRRSDCFGFWEAEAKALQAGDVIIEIVIGSRLSTAPLSQNGAGMPMWRDRLIDRQDTRLESSHE